MKWHHSQNGTTHKTAPLTKRHHSQNGTTHKKALLTKRHHSQNGTIHKTAPLTKRHHSQNGTTHKTAPLTKRHHSQNGNSNIFTVGDESNKIYSFQNKIAIQLKHFKLGACCKFQGKIILIFPTHIFCE
jgi:hypothetical protein